MHDTISTWTFGRKPNPPALCAVSLAGIVRRKPSTHFGPSANEASLQSHQPHQPPPHAQTHAMPGMTMVDHNNQGAAPGLSSYPMLTPAFLHGMAPPSICTEPGMRSGMGNMVDGSASLEQASSYLYQQYRQRTHLLDQQHSQHGAGPFDGVMGPSQTPLPVESPRDCTSARGVGPPKSSGLLPGTGPGAFTTPVPFPANVFGAASTSYPEHAPSSTIASALLDAVALAQSMPDGLPPSGVEATSMCLGTAPVRPPATAVPQTDTGSSDEVLQSQTRLQQVLTDYLRPGMRLLQAVDAAPVAMGLAAVWDMQQGMSAPGSGVAGATAVGLESSAMVKRHLHAHRHPHAHAMVSAAGDVIRPDPVDGQHSGTTSSWIASAPAVVGHVSLSSGDGTYVEDQAKGSNTQLAGTDSGTDGAGDASGRAATRREVHVTHMDSETSGSNGDRSGRREGGAAALLGSVDVEEHTKVNKRNRASLYGSGGRHNAPASSGDGSDRPRSDEHTNTGELTKP